MIPDFVKNIKGLKLFDRFLLSQIHYLSSKKGYCFAGNSYFVDFFEVSEGTVKRSLKKMEDMGLISRVTTWNKRYIYLTCLPAGQEKKEENVEKVEEKTDKRVVRYSREGLKYWSKIQQQRPTKYHKAPKDKGWTKEGIAAADECFSRWKEKIAGDG